MARLPISGSDSGVWGDVLNSFLLESHTSSGGLKEAAVSVAGAILSSEKGVVNGVASLNGSGQIPVAQLGSGTASSSTYIRGDGAWAALAITDSDVSAISESKITNLTTDLAGKLAVANNLSDVSNVATARTNLAVPQASGFATITVGTTAPVGPSVGDLWVDTN